MELVFKNSSVLISSALCVASICKSYVRSVWLDPGFNIPTFHYCFNTYILLRLRSSSNNNM